MLEILETRGIRILNDFGNLWEDGVIQAERKQMG